MKDVIDPDMLPLLEKARAARAVEYSTIPIAEARQLVEDVARYWNEPPVPVTRVDNISVPGAAGPMRARLYHPAGQERRPVIVWAHGGGWSVGSVDSHDSIMRNLANEFGCAVLGFDYRLAPEHPFPAGFDDTRAALHFVRAGGLGQSIDPDRIALGGDSAGANLALAAMVADRDEGLPPVKTALLYYGCFAPVFDTPSHRRYGGGSFVLTTAGMRWYWDNFIGTAHDAITPLAAPLRADLSALPPLYLSAAGLDPLLDDTMLMAARLSEFGIRYRLDVFPGVVHGYLRMARELPAARAAIRAGGEFAAALLRS